MQEEIWKDIKDYEGIYQISNFGRVKSLARWKGCIFQEDKILKTRKKSKKENDYLIVDLLKKYKRKTIGVHRLVANAFISNPENKSEVNHKDGNKLNNRVDNLEWSTHKENMQHAIDIKLFDEKGENNHNSKLKEKDVLFMVENKNKYSAKEFSKMFNISELYVYLILSKKRWRYLYKNEYSGI